MTPPPQSPRRPPQRPTLPEWVANPEADTVSTTLSWRIRQRVKASGPWQVLARLYWRVAERNRLRARYPRLFASLAVFAAWLVTTAMVMFIYYLFQVAQTIGVER